MDFSAIGEKMETRGIAPREYEEAYINLVERKIPFVCVPLGGEWGDPIRIKEYSIALRQTLLHRATLLLKGAIKALLEDNVYLIALAVRGHYETTAVMGFLYSRLVSLKEGNLQPADVDKDIGGQILGTRDKKILGIAKDVDLEAKQIMTLLDHADRMLNKHILGARAKEHAMLRDVYEWLCEFCHPNFHSNYCAFTLDAREGVIHFKGDEKLTVDEAKIINNILLSNRVFVALFDSIQGLLPENKRGSQS